MFRFKTPDRTVSTLDAWSSIDKKQTLLMCNNKTGTAINTNNLTFLYEVIRVYKFHARPVRTKRNTHLVYVLGSDLPGACSSELVVSGQRFSSVACTLGLLLWQGRSIGRMKTVLEKRLISVSEANARGGQSVSPPRSARK